MAETSKADHDLRFRNVTLHSLGRKEHGSLYLTRHHLLFSFIPNAKKAEHTPTRRHHGIAGDDASQHRTTLPPESSTSTASPKVSVEGRTSAESAAMTPKQSSEGPQSISKDSRKETRAKIRPKEIWLPYPMISHCTLRPSHLQSQTMRVREDTEHSPASHEEGELFPPTFGTATYARPSSDSARLAPYSSPARPRSPVGQDVEEFASSDGGRQPAIRVRCKDMRMMALHFHSDQSSTPADETARKVFYILRSRCCVDKAEDLHAFHFRPPREEVETAGTDYDARKEYARMGISGKAADGPGTAWRISDINRDYSYSATYPSVLCVPRAVSDNMLKYGGVFRSRARIPCLAYLHSNGGSITRSSQPMVGVQNRRNPQDEKLVSAIFSSHTPPLISPEESPPEPTPLNAAGEMAKASSSEPVTTDTDFPGLPTSHSDTALDDKSDEKASQPRKKVYGSTRRNLIVDARPKINALANRATGGGIEDIANYVGNGEMRVEKMFLNIANIHVMRASLEKVIDSFANSDYIDMKPDQESLRKSGWLGHIAGMLDGAEMIARVVGLGGSHVLIHCSDGWDRTAQISALVQIMLDPHYRTLDGFISLIQKEFLSFGHKFRDRNGVEGSEKWFEIENERIAPSRTRENNGTDPNSLNALGAKAFSGAKTWFEKSRGNLFRQQNRSRDSLGDQSPSRPSSPPPNSVLHSPPSSTGKEEREHRISDKEISPIFHQFLDTVYQLQHQNPKAFEFTERLLLRLFYHTYACQYGEFLFNTEKERNQQMGKLPSVWKHFLSRRQDFINPDYTTNLEDPLLFPKRQGFDREIEVRWWSGLFKRDDGQMNLPRALAPADPPAMTATLGSSVSFDDQAPTSDKGETPAASNGALKESKSTPSLSAMDESVGNSFQALSVDANDTKIAAATELFVPQHGDSENQQNKTDEPVPTPSQSKMSPMAMEYEGDPLGVNKSMPRKTEGSGLDFAAFASQNAFKDR